MNENSDFEKSIYMPSKEDIKATASPDRFADDEDLLEQMVGDLVLMSSNSGGVTR